MDLTDRQFDIRKHASAAKIYLSDAEAEELNRDMAPLFEMAESLPDISMSEATEPLPNINMSEAAVSLPGLSMSQVADNANIVLTVSGLRDDTPSHEIETDVFYEQSPSAGGDGFTIPRLLE